MEDRCYICGRRATDKAHVLPRSLFPEYITREDNIVPLCRGCHRLYDNNLQFRKKQLRMYRLAEKVDKRGAMKYFEFSEKDAEMVQKKSKFSQLKTGKNENIL